MRPRMLVVHALSLLTLVLFMTAGSSLHPARGQLAGGRAAAAPTAGGGDAGTGGSGGVAPAAAADGPRVKVRVTEPSVTRSLTDAGARLIADYGGFQVLAVDPTTAASLAGQDGGEIRNDYDVIQLNTGPIHTTSPEAQALRTGAGAFSGKRLYLVQFAGPILPAWVEALEKTGVQVITYIPANAYLVYGDAGSLGQVHARAASSPEIQWDGEFRDDY